MLDHEDELTNRRNTRLIPRRSLGRPWVALIVIIALAASCTGTTPSANPTEPTSTVAVSTARLSSDVRGSLQALLGLMDEAFCSHRPTDLSKAFTARAAALPGLIRSATTGPCTVTIIKAIDASAQSTASGITHEWTSNTTTGNETDKAGAAIRNSQRETARQNGAIIRVAVDVQTNLTTSTHYWPLKIAPTDKDGWLRDTSNGEEPLRDYCTPPEGSDLPPFGAQLGCP